jgi:2-haloacid dehalogenase
MQEVTDIVFDLGGVLVDWNPRHLFIGRMSEAPEEVESCLAEVCTRDWHETIDKGVSFESAVGRLIQVVPSREAWIRAYVERWEEMFAGEFTPVVELLAELDDRGYRLHALSNYPRQQIAFLYRTYPFMRRFHSVVISGLIGMIKPQHGIYRYLIDRIGRDAFVFLDDSPANVEAAVGLGIHAYLLRGTDDVGRLDMLRDALTGPGSL